MDWFWKFEKKWYAFASPSAQSWARRAYIGAFLPRMLLAGASPRSYLESYLQNRGMSFEHDVHDWLGGWPYESISAGELHARMATGGFRSLCASEASLGLVRTAGRKIGLFGSGCDEYVFERVS
jgi:2-polyprenyl-6-hydroxyphenyl methylase/3-demethylubiquinone-9 3-methyltransferase